MITMFQVNHLEDPPPELLLQHVLNEGQRIAVRLRLRIHAVVVDHQPPFPGHLLGDDKAEGCPLGVTGLQPTWVDELPRIFLMASFLSPLRANSRCRYTRASGCSRILASPYGPRTGCGKTGFPLKKVSPYFCFTLALNAWILGHSSDSALALPDTWTTEVT